MIPYEERLLLKGGNRVLYLRRSNVVAILITVGSWLVHFGRSNTTYLEHSINEAMDDL